MDDPYCWPGTTCLRNKLGIRDAQELLVAESQITSVRDADVARQLVPGEYDLEHLRDFHAWLFRDVYDWAGDTRTVDISKPGTTFCHFRFVDAEISSILRKLPGEDYLLGLNRRPFVERLAYYYGEINARHPFREGNGRAQRAFLRQLAAAAGWNIAWSGMDREANIEACRANFQTGDEDGLIAILEPLLSKA